MRCLALMLSMLLAGCEPCEPTDLWLELGAASPSGFVPLADVDHRLAITFGPQGGEHLELAARVRGVPYRGWENSLELTGYLDEAAVASGWEYLDLRCDPRAPYDEIPYVFLVFDTIDPWANLDRELHVHATLRTDDGSTAHGEARVVIAP